MTLYRVLRPLLFRLDPERSHRLVLACLAAYERVLARRWPPQAWTHPALQQVHWNLRFPNPIGLAAGFDKDARAPHVWPLLGFGFAELGTITAEPQPGNPTPRLFRFPRDRALINRFGFNNAGAGAVARRLGGLQQAQRARIPLGINIGKSRIVALERAVDDYLRSFRELFLCADYFVINVSSPNTPGLRDLQSEEHLAALLRALAKHNDVLARTHRQSQRPLLIKLAPDLADEALAKIVEVARDCGAAGLVATNTTTARAGLTTPSGESGGLSGAPLRERATAVIRTLRRAAGADLPIIGGGGIFTASEAYEKICAGAALVQIYTGMIYEGPRLPYRIAHGLVDLLHRDGFTHLREAVGRDA
jgi:dihydroorotate dehydrogenase